LWLCLSGETVAPRLRGPLALVLLLPAALLFVNAIPSTADDTPLAPRSLTQYATLLLGTLVLIELSWASLDPAVAVPWVQRNGLTMSVCSLLTLCYGVGLVRWLPGASGWPARSRDTALSLGALALVLLTAVLAQEAISLQEGGPVPMLPSVL